MILSAAEMGAVGRLDDVNSIDDLGSFNCRACSASNEDFCFSASVSETLLYST